LRQEKTKRPVTPAQGSYLPGIHPGNFKFLNPGNHRELMPYRKVTQVFMGQILP
jgi:hypothetical protein